MKIKVIKACTFSFAPAEKIVYFIVDEICELPEDRAKHLIKHNYAVEYSESEQKMDKTEPENKMLNVKHEENKAIDQDSEVKVKHEDSVEKEEEEKEKPKKRGRPKKNK